MASNKRRLTGYQAFPQESACTIVPGPVTMDRTVGSNDSGFYSNITSRSGQLYAGPSSIQEEDDYQCEEAMDWQQGYQHRNTYGYDAEPSYVDPQHDSNYTVMGTGDQMAGYYPPESTPRTLTFGAIDDDQNMNHPWEFDDNDPGSYIKDEPAPQWPSHLPHYPADSYSSYTQPTISPTGEAEPLSYFPSPPQPTYPATAAPTPTRHPLPSSSQHPSANQPQPPPASAPASLPSPATTTTTPTTRFPCLAPSCSKQFNRAADLDRHMKHVHCRDNLDPRRCDYRRCARHANPFRRSDHFRDHLRDQHREDLLKRGEGGGATPDRAWWAGRSPTALWGGWWRCGKCFARVVVEREGWQCGGCQNFCEQERQGVRGLPRGCGYVGCEEGGEGEGEGRGEGWLSVGRLREHLRGVHGEDVPVREGKEGEKELESEEWWAGREVDVVYDSKWRCTRCLERVEGREEGWECPRCGFACEEVRRGYHVGFQVDDK